MVRYAKIALMVLVALLITPVLAAGPESRFYMVPTDKMVYSLATWDASVYQDGTYTIAVNRTGGIINATLISAHTDDVPIQAALDSTMGGVTDVGLGTYYITHSINLKYSNTLLYGHGSENDSATHCTRFFAYNLGSNPVISSSINLVHYEIKHIFIDGQRGTNSGDGIQLGNPGAGTIEDVAVFQAGRDGINITGEQNRIVNCAFTWSARYGVFLNGLGNNQLENNQIGFNDDGGIYMWGTYNNAIYDTTTFYNGGPGITVYLGARMNHIVNSRSYLNYGNGISIDRSNDTEIMSTEFFANENSNTTDGVYVGRSSYNTSILYSKFYGEASGINYRNQRWDVELVNSSRNTQVIGNNFVEWGMAPVYIESGATYKFRDNIGYLTENESYTASVSDGGTIAHGMSVTPNWCKPFTTMPNETATANNLGSTSFNVAIKKNFDGSPGTTQTIDWKCGI